MPSKIDNKTRKFNWIRHYKESHPKCRRCGDVFHRCQLDLHHPHPELKHPKLKERKKGGKVKELVHLRWDELRTEVMMCWVLCKNCHAMVHEEMRQQEKGEGGVLPL